MATGGEEMRVQEEIEYPYEEMSWALEDVDDSTPWEIDAHGVYVWSGRWVDHYRTVKPH